MSDERGPEAPPDATVLPDATELPDYAPMAATARTDSERWPTLSPAGHERLARWRMHPNAPRWVHECGDLLTTDDHVRLRALRTTLASRAAGHPAEASPAADAEPPAWVEDLVQRCTEQTGFYRRWGRTAFADLPLVSRADLVRDVADFVPRDVPLDRVVQGTSSGSTGAALVVPLDPVSISADLVLLEHLVREAGVDWPEDPSRFGLLSVVDQEQAFTYASVLTLRGEQPMARVSLAASAWRRPGDREAFLGAARAQVVVGTALSLLALAGLADPEERIRPSALVSGAVALTPAARARLGERFGVPVVDLYGLKETGPVAASADGGPHRVVPRHLHLEVVDPGGRPLPDGERGELVVTTDEKPHLPLLRYRTGDHAALGRSGGHRTVVGLSGRAPVVFRAGDGRAVPSVELTQQLQHHGALAWSVHQHGDGSVVARLALGGGSGAGPAGRALTALLRRTVEVEVVTDPGALGPGKPRMFSSDVEGDR